MLKRRNSGILTSKFHILIFTFLIRWLLFLLVFAFRRAFVFLFAISGGIRRFVSGGLSSRGGLLLIHLRADLGKRLRQIVGLGLQLLHIIPTLDFFQALNLFFNFFFGRGGNFVARVAHCFLRGINQVVRVVRAVISSCFLRSLSALACASCLIRSPLLWKFPPSLQCGPALGFSGRLSLAVTLKIPLASISNETSTGGMPRGAGIMPSKMNLPKDLLSALIGRSPCKTWISTEVWCRRRWKRLATWPWARWYSWKSESC